MLQLRARRATGLFFIALVSGVAVQWELFSFGYSQNETATGMYAAMVTGLASCVAGLTALVCLSPLWQRDFVRRHTFTVLVVTPIVFFLATAAYVAFGVSLSCQNNVCLG